MKNSLPLGLCIISIVMGLTPAYASDYGWMPREERAFVSIGSDYFGTGSNYVTTGQSVPLSYNGQSASLAQYNFWGEFEYGITKGWAIRLRLNAISESLSGSSTYGSTSVLTAGGLQDILAGIKVQLNHGKPLVVLDTTVKVPTYSSYLSASQVSSSLVPGDGDVELGVATHIALSGKTWLVDGSPQFLYRTVGYANAFILRAAGGLKGTWGYALATARLYASLGSNALYDSTLYIHDAQGTGGSYALLSGSPSLFTVGLKGGVRLSNLLFLEGDLEKSTWGVRAPNFFQVGLNLLFTFDIHHEDTRVRIREIPFDSEPEMNPDGTAPGAPVLDTVKGPADATDAPPSEPAPKN